MTKDERDEADGCGSAIPDRGAWSFLLVPCFLLGPETWRGVAEVLDQLDYPCAVAGPRVTTPRDDDHIGPWVDEVVAAAEPLGDAPLVLVGHSATCARLPQVALRLLELGRTVHAVVVVNGRVPWRDGEAPVEADPPLRSLLDNLVRPDDYLPPWHRWWGSMIVSMVPDRGVRRRVFAEARPVPRAVFDQPVWVPELPASVRRCYLATSTMSVPDYDRAAGLGWTVARLDGEHLHMAVEPVAVAGMLLSLCRRCPPRSSRPDCGTSP